MSKFSYVYQDPSSFTTGTTPYGTYDADGAFQADIILATQWIAKRLGHPVMQLEFNTGSIYATFEEAVSEYSLHINNYNMKNWLWENYGAEEKINVTDSLGTGSIEPTHAHMGTTFFQSKQYGEAIALGGDRKLQSGSIALSASKQVYDLQAFADTHESGRRLEITRMFNIAPAAITRFYDPFAGSYDQRIMLDDMGFGNVSPAVSYVLRPISYDIARAQAIETNDKIRKSAYSFEIINNKVRIFPEPDRDSVGNKIWFEYYVRDDLAQVTSSYTTGKVSDPSNVPYKFITYSQINASGRQWIRKYALALAKELLGIIRSKYASMPLPNGEVSMDGEGLKAEGREEKNMLADELKEFLESVSLTEKSRAEQEQAEAQQSVLNKAPLGIYIG